MLARTTWRPGWLNRGHSESGGRLTGPVPTIAAMAMVQQRTLRSMTRAVGVGVHGGQRVELTLRPAPPDHGIVFRRVDLPQPVSIPLSAEVVSDTRMATTLSPGGDPGAPKVKTVEHLLSACAGLGLDNLTIDLTADEVPVLDGSGASFVFL